LSDIIVKKNSADISSLLSTNKTTIAVVNRFYSNPILNYLQYIFVNIISYRYISISNTYYEKN